jgi:hypothetical protein
MTIEFYKHFDLSKTQLVPKDILDYRDEDYDGELFFDDDVYQRIKSSILTRDVTLILGNPLSGKTRIVYDTLKSLKKWNLLIPNKSKEIPEYRLPTNMSQIVVILDDIDDYCIEDNMALNKLLKTILDNRIKCIITCRKGPEFNKLKGYTNSNTFYRITQNKFIIPRFDKRENIAVQNFLTLNISKFKSSIQNFDGNFGSVVMPLDAMRERFHFLKNAEKDKAIAILLGLKLHFHLFNYEGNKSHYDDKKIKFFCEKYLKEELSMSEWEEAKNELISNLTSLNFIDISTEIVIEEAYLDFLTDMNGNCADVVHSDFNEKRLQDLCNKLYLPEQKKAYGFPLTVRDYNMLIKNASSFDEGEKIFNKIHPRDRDSYSFTSLMDLATDKTKLINLYKDMRKNGVKTLFAPNYVFINKFDNFKDLFDVLFELDRRLLDHRNGTTNRLINLAELTPHETLQYLFLKLKPTDIYKNPVYNQIVRLCCTNFDDYTTFVEPALPLLDSLDSTLRKNIIKAIIDLKLFHIALPLVKKYLTKYDYCNEYGNCIKESEPLNAFTSYKNSFEFIEYNSQEQKTLTNLNKVIFSNFNLISEDEKIDIFSKTHKFLNANRNDPKTARTKEFLAEELLLNELMIVPISSLKERLEILITYPYFPLRLFEKIINRVSDADKKTILEEFLQ